VFRDFLWAQYCLFLYSIVRDDLMDGQYSARRIDYREFLREAARAYRRHFRRGSPFWSLYSPTVRHAIRSFREASRLQRTLRPNPDRLLKLYAELCSILKISSYATCIYTGHEHDIPFVDSYCNALATAGQIGDDLKDVLDDLTGGRVNYVSAVLLKGNTGRGGREMLPARRIRMVYRVMQLHLKQARDASLRFGLQAATDHVGRFQRRVDRVSERIERQSLGVQRN